MKKATKVIKSIVNDTISQLQKDIQSHSSAKVKAGAEKYMKYLVKYRGMSSGDLRTKIWKNFWSDQIKPLELEDQKEIAHTLLTQEFGEDRFVGMLILEKLKGKVELDDIKKIEKLFTDGHLVGWASTDGVCGTVFQHWTKGNIKNTKYISNWRNSDCLWLQRASCVAFVNLAKYGDKEPNFEGFFDILKETCLKTIQNQERFVQLGTGWLLRNMGTVNKELLFEFIESNITHFSREGLSYAVEKLKPADKKRMTSLRTKVPVETLEEEVKKALEEDGVEVKPQKRTRGKKN